jgi:mannosyl-oligosaccharide alpha-1,3-glucosidase
MTWDPEKFDGVEEFIKELDHKKRNLVVIIDPHIKKDSGYSIYREAVNNRKIF